MEKKMHDKNNIDINVGLDLDNVYNGFDQGVIKKPWKTVIIVLLFIPLVIGLGVLFVDWRAGCTVMGLTVIAMVLVGIFYHPKNNYQLNDNHIGSGYGQ